MYSVAGGVPADNLTVDSDCPYLREILWQVRAHDPKRSIPLLEAIVVNMLRYDAEQERILFILILNRP
jgi:hypothetical protein